jgi:hypothetical protein
MERKTTTYSLAQFQLLIDTQTAVPSERSIGKHVFISRPDAPQAQTLVASRAAGHGRRKSPQVGTGDAIRSWFEH